jgi:secreted trypsin-like serine protease
VWLLAASAAQQHEARIIGGSRVYDRCVEPYNAMVAFQLFPNDPTLKLTFCSGVMITSSIIVTSALCVYP